MILKTSKGDFLIRPYQPGDEALICKTWALAFGKEFPLPLWHWKYRSNPLGFAALLCLAENGDLAVYYGGQYQRIICQGKSYLALHLADNFTHPAYRWAVGGKKSLFARVARIFWNTYLEYAPFEEESLPLKVPKALFVWGIPGWRHFRLGELMVNYARQPYPAFYAVRKGLKPRPVKKIFWGQEISARSYEKIWEKHQILTFGLAKDWPLFSWRYLNHPERPYLLAAYPSKDPKALLVLKEEKKRIILVDLLVSDLCALWTLLEGLLAKFPNRSIQIWLSGNSPFKEVFLAAGWREEPEPLGIIPAIKGFFPEFEEVAKRFSWTMGDADLF